MRTRETPSAITSRILDIDPAELPPDPWGLLAHLLEGFDAPVWIVVGVILVGLLAGWFGFFKKVLAYGTFVANKATEWLREQGGPWESVVTVLALLGCQVAFVAWVYTYVQAMAAGRGHATSEIFSILLEEWADPTPAAVIVVKVMVAGLIVGNVSYLLHPKWIALPGMLIGWLLVGIGWLSSGATVLWVLHVFSVVFQAEYHYLVPLSLFVWAGLAVLAAFSFAFGSLFAHMD